MTARSPHCQVTYHPHKFVSTGPPYRRLTTMKRTLIATFTLAKASVEFMVLSMNTRTGGNVDVAIKMVEPGVTSVTGRPQDIMMVIGQIASYGEDGLLSVAER